jgi:Autographiviridae endonuclease VII
VIDIPVVICRRCKIPKLPSQLRKPHASGRLHRICKICSMQEAMDWSKKNPQRHRAIGQRYYRNNIAKFQDRSQEYYLANRETSLAREREYRTKYPWRHQSQHRPKIISRLLFDKFMRVQSGVCAICGLPPTGQALRIDHDHLTGERRGLLCQQCNHGIGNFLDDPHLLKRAIEYLQLPTSRKLTTGAVSAAIQ